MIIRGIGSYLPGNVITNGQLADIFGDSVHHIGDYFGVHGRHFTLDYQTGKNKYGLNSDFAINAVINATKNWSGFDRSAVGLIISTSTTPDHNLPTLSALIQEKLNIPSAIPIDIRGGCAACLQALLVAKIFLDAHLVEQAIVVGSECCSSVFYEYLLANRTSATVKDMMNSLIFGDGAAAVILESGRNGGAGFYCDHIEFSSDMVNQKPGFIFDWGGTTLSVLGKSVAISTLFRHFPKQIEQFLPILVKKTQSHIRSLGYELMDFVHVIGPQANHRLVTEMNRLLRSKSQYYYIGDKIGNVPGGALMIALDHLVMESNIPANGRLLMMGMESPKWTSGFCVLRKVVNQ